jgi:threonine dehydrogenase-like Zn-dependent dehydrogenase
MLAYTYMEKGLFQLQEKPKPALKEKQDAIVKVTLASICASDLHIKYGNMTIKTTHSNFFIFSSPV